MNVFQQKICGMARLAAIILIPMSMAWAANTGKVAGTVTAKSTGEPLIGANVMVLGTDLGAATDESGRFNVLQIPPGRYSVQVSYIGYHSLTITEVDVQTDLTTRLTIALDSEAITSPTVEVVAEKRMVQQDVTATRRSFSQQEIEDAPSIESTEDVLRMQGGVFIEAAPQRIELGQGIHLEPRDPSLKSLNIRGGRGGSSLILIDGIPATSPLLGGFDVMNLNVENIRDIEIITGAFSAEYGQATSAVINIVTRSGTDRFSGSMNYRTDAPSLFGPSYEKHRFSATLRGPEPLTGGLLNSVGIKIPGKITVFATGSFNVTNTPYNNNRLRDPLYTLTSPVFNSSLVLNEKQENEANLNFRLDYKLSAKLKFMLSYRNALRRWTPYNWQWKYFPENMSEYSRDSRQWQFRISHTLSNKTFYKVNFGYTGVDYMNSNNGRNPETFWVMREDTMYTTVQPPAVDPTTGFFNGQGYQTAYIVNNNNAYTVRFDFTSQAHPEHMIKLGFNVEYKDLHNVHINGGGFTLSRYGLYLYEDGEKVVPPAGPYKAFGATRWVINGYPMDGGIYLTDKFEKESLIINAGIRFDWFRPGPPTTRAAWKEQWDRVTGPELQPDWPTIHYQLDPRFGVSFPISPQTNIYFSYGHFNNMPGLDNYLRDPYSGSFTGNPHLQFIKTVKYEFGFTNEFLPGWAIDIKNYTKETSGETGLTELSSEVGLLVFLSDNKGYSRARGLEFELRRQQRNIVWGNAIYTLQWASGYSSSVFDDYRRSLDNIPNPIRERRLNWDIRHQVVIRANVGAGKNRQLELFGLTLPPDWQISILSRLQSGQPYTPGVHDPIDAQILNNSRTGPPSYNTDVKFEKTFRFGEAVQLKLGLDVDNIFNQYNVHIHRAFNNWTGKPYKYGDTIQDTDHLYNYYDMLQLLNPNRFGQGRHTQLVFELNW